MSNFRITSTNHRSFTFSDLERSLAFFRDGLGFEVTSIAPRDPALVSHVTGVGGADVLIGYVRGPDHSLELIQYNGLSTRAKVLFRPSDTGFAHVAYNVDDVDVAAAERFGVLPINPPIAIDQGPNKGRKVVYPRDWDGVTIDFIETPHT